MDRAALAMSAVFVWGTLCHPALLAVVLGGVVPTVPAVLEGAVVLADGDTAQLVAQDGATAPGLLLSLGAEAAARLDFYAAVLGLAGQSGQVRVGAVLQDVRLHRGAAGQGPAWSLSGWQAQHGDEAVATAGDIMALCGVKPPQALHRRLAQIRVRGAARLRAGETAPATRRLAAAPGDVVVAARREPYAAFFSVEEYDLRFRRFDGGLSPEVTRAVFVSGDAVTVLPYDAQRDRVLVVEQFRTAPHARGDANPWQIEAIAGRIDAGETAETAARREAVEEAGLHLGALLPVAGYYPSPGICAEYLYSYVALCDLPDGAAGVFGLEGEAEDIRGHLMALDDLMALVASGEVGNAPLMLSALWLQRERPRLRAGG